MSLQLAAASYIYIHYASKKKRQERRWWQTKLYTSRDVNSGSSLLADLNFHSVSGLYKNFTRMSPSEFEFLINLTGEIIAKKDTAFRKAISVQERLALTLRFLASGDSTLACSTSSKFPKSTPFHNYQHAQETTKHYILAPFFKTEALGRKRRAEEWTVVTLRVTLPVHTYSDRNRIIPLMRRRNTDSAPNKPVT